MITRTDIEEILYDKCRDFGVETYLADTTPIGEIKEERLVIIPKNIQDGRYWYRCFVEVNWCVPDIHNEKDGVRIKSVEKSMSVLDYGQGLCDGTQYRWKKESEGVESEPEANYHYVNKRLLFNIQKVK